MRGSRWRSASSKRRDAVAAAAVALALHAGLGWGLSELLMGGSRPAPSIVADDVLQVVWLAPIAVEPTPLVVPAPRIRVEEVAVAWPGTRSEDIPAARAPIPAPPVPPLSGEGLRVQAREWAQQQAPLEFAGADPLANRIAALPGRPANRFRMPAPLSAADIVGFIGQTFGNGEDPCVLNRADLAAYATGRDARALALAVDFERRHCRP